jgi:O-antigen ligase
LLPAILYNCAVTTLSDPFAADRTKLDRLGLVLALFSLLLAPLGLLAAKAVVPLVLAAAAAGGLVTGAAALPWRIVDRRLALALGLLIGWCLLTALWSFHPLASANLALRVGLLILALLYLIALAQMLRQEQRVWVARGFCLGFAVTVAIVAIELSFGAPIFTLLDGPAGSDYAAFSRLNRGVSALAVLVWPLAALVWQKRLHGLALALPPAVLGLALLSQSAASMLALAVGLLAAAAASLGRGATRVVLAVAVVGTLLGTPLVVGLLQQAGLERADFVPETGRYRIHVWGVVTERIAERPVAGWGFDTSPDLPTGDAQPFRPGETVIPQHPHNGALQIMVEVGAVGSLLAVLVLFVVGQRIDRLPRPQRSSAAAMLITVLVSASPA